MLPGPSTAEALPRADATTRDLLAPIALERARLFSGVLFVAMTAWFLVLASTSRIDAFVVLINVVMCSLVGAIAVVSRRAVAARWGDRLCVLLWCAPAACTLVAHWRTPEPLFAMLLSLEMVGAVVLLDTRWVVGTTLVALALWVPLSLREPARDAIVFIMTAVTAQMFAIVMQVILRRALVRQVVTAAELERQLAERTRLEQQLLHAQRMEAVGTLAAGLAHDMNNVLASIASFASLLEDEVQSPGGRADLDQIVTQADRGAELTRSLLAFSRRGQYRKQPIRIDDVVREVLPLLERTLPRSITIARQLNGAKSCIAGDPIRLGQAVVNLGLNARDAMAGAGELVIATEVIELTAAAATALALPPGCYARLSVTDSGVGMDDATRRRVFEPFFTTKPGGKGTGLGLSAVWGIVQSHDGAVTVESSPGNGATFAIHLPVIETTTPTRTIPVVERTASLRRVGTVLVVDDEPAVRAGTARILERMGLAAISAANGEEALERYRAHGGPIDLVVLDMGMPVMGGAECFRQLRTLGQVPVLIATGYAIDAKVQELVAAGAALIEKPYRANDLTAAVARLLERTRAAASAR